MDQGVCGPHPIPIHDLSQWQLVTIKDVMPAEFGRLEWARKFAGLTVI